MSINEPRSFLGLNGPIRADVTDNSSNHWVIQVSGSNNTIAIDCNHGAVFTLRSWDQLRSAQSSVESFFTADEGDETTSLKTWRLSPNCQRAYEATRMILRQSNPGFYDRLSKMLPSIHSDSADSRLAIAGNDDSSSISSESSDPDLTSIFMEQTGGKSSLSPSFPALCNLSLNRNIPKPTEEWWRDHYSWLEERGYRLRAEYMPGQQICSKDGKAKAAQIAEHLNIINAVSFRTYPDHCSSFPCPPDVCLKRVNKRYSPLGTQLAKDFGAGKRSTDNHNHCVPILEVLSVDEEWDILVMPPLRPLAAVAWKNSREVIELVTQLFQGLTYMHHRGLSYLACVRDNIMMGGSPFRGGHTRSTSWLKAAPKYYFVDSSLARYCHPGQLAMLTRAPNSLDLAPELQNRAPGALYDPFAVDVYMLGHLLLTTLQKEFLRWKKDLSFIQTLLFKMTKKDPSKRPRMKQVDAMFDYCKMVVICGAPLNQCISLNHEYS